MSEARVHEVMHYKPGAVEKCAKAITGPKKHGKTIAAAKAVSRKVYRKKG